MGTMLSKSNQILKLANYFLFLIAEEDVNYLTPEEYQKCMNDPDCFSKYRMQSAERQKRYHARQQQAPSEEYLKRRQTYQEARKSLRGSDSLEGFSSILAQKIQTIKSDLAKKIKAKVNETYKQLPLIEQTPERWKTEIENFPAFKEFVQDSKDLYYFRDKIKEFSAVLDGKNTISKSNEKKMVKQLKNISKDMFKLYGNKYKSLSSTMQEIISKLESY